MKAISFNIHTSVNPREDGDNAWKRRAHAVRNMIKTEAPDVMGVQEALLDQLSYIDNSFKLTYRRVGVGRDNGITRGEHTAIYYNIKRIELLWHSTRWLSPMPFNVSRGWDAGCHRTVTIAKFRDIETGKVFFYFNTQLDNVGKVSRRESVKYIAQLVKAIPHNTPVIVGGDLYMSSSDALLEPFSDAGLSLARSYTSISDDKPSYNGFGKQPEKTEDEFYVRRIKVYTFKTLDKNYGVPYISNHYPIEIIFEL